MSTPVWAAWHGGPSYAPTPWEESEEFSSVQAVRDAMQDRYINLDGRTPCVEEDAMYVFRGDPRESGGDPYPDLILTRGPRGGIQSSPC